jgi:hypothetical protein
VARKSRKSASKGTGEIVGKLALVGVREVWRNGTSEEIVYTEWIGPVAEIDAAGRAVIADPYLGKREYPAGMLFPVGKSSVRAGAALIGFVEFVRTGTPEKHETKTDYFDTAERVLAALKNPS